MPKSYCNQVQAQITNLYLVHRQAPSDRVEARRRVLKVIVLSRAVADVHAKKQPL